MYSLNFSKGRGFIRQEIRDGEKRRFVTVKRLGKVSRTESYEQLARFREQLKIKPKYRTIVIDPPWPMEKIKRKVAPNQTDMDYKTMSVDEIKNFPLPKFISPDGAHIYLWTTQKYLPTAFELFKSWGIEYILTLVWQKSGGFQPYGLPQYNCEFVLFGKVGTLSFTTVKNFPCCFQGKRREHSRKPDEFYDIVRRVSPDPRIDIFSREKREGWDGWGYEVEKFSGVIK